MSNQQHLNDLVEFYSSHGCINSKQEIIASPSCLPYYKNKSEEQILYEYLKEKRGPPKKSADLMSELPSRIERDNSGSRGREQPSSSFINRASPDEYDREGPAFQSRINRQPAENTETRKPNEYSNEPSNREYGSKSNLLDHRESPAERRGWNNNSNMRGEEEEPMVPKEDPKPAKKTSALMDRLTAKKKEMGKPKPEEASDEPSSKSNPKEKASYLDQDPEELNFKEEPRNTQASSAPKKPGFMNFVAESEARDHTLNQSINNLSFGSDMGSSLIEKSQSKAHYMEEPTSLMNQVSDYREIPSRQAFERRMQRERDFEEEPSEGKLKRIPEQESKPSGSYQGSRESKSPHIRPDEDEDDYKPRQERGPRIVRLSEPERREDANDQKKQSQRILEGSERFLGRDLYESEKPGNSPDGTEIKRSKIEYSFQKDRMPIDEEESSLLPERNREPEREAMWESKEMKFSRERDFEGKKDEEYKSMTRGNDARESSKRDSMRQSQTSQSSKPRGNEEQDYDEAEREPLIKEEPKSAAREFIRPKKDNIRDFEGEKPYEYNDQKPASELRSRASQQVASALDKPTRSETSLAESTDKKSNEKAGGRSVTNYLKSIEEMLAKLLAKQEILEENQRKMMQVQKRQQEAIEDLRLQMTGEE